MEKDLFPLRAGETPTADRAPRLETVPGGDHDGGHHHHGGCGCGCGQDQQNGCGAGICVGYEGCGEGSWGLSEYPLAMVYAPCQHFRALYDPATALMRGTLFTELDLPLGHEGCGFTTEGCSCRAERRRT